jgi:trehalose-6-phosphate synthase
LSPFIQPDDVIWVHDYHLLSLAKELRELGHNNPIGFFLHIPCPPPDVLMSVFDSTERSACRKLLILQMRAGEMALV